MREFSGSVRADGLRFESTPAAREVAGLRVLYRGYVANRAALRALASDGRFAPRDGEVDGHRDADDDAALFALAYDRWGAELSRHVLGEYAVAIHDAARRRIVLAHDELGLMPLFYCAEPHALAFASHLDDLVARTGVRALDEEYLADYFASGDHFGDRTPYAHLRRLLPGESATWDGGTLARHDVWTLDRVEPLRARDPREYDERMRALLEEAVVTALPARERTVWCELSGGLDSSTVLELANRARGDVEALSFVYPSSYTADERDWIEVALRHSRTPWHPIDVDAARPFTAFPERFAGEPNGWIASAAHERIYTGLLDAHGVDVVLSGEGGDAVLLGDAQQPLYLADLLLAGRIGALWRESRRWSDASRNRRAPTYWLLAGALRPALLHLRGRPLEYRPVPIPWADEGYAARTNLANRGRRHRPVRAGSVGAGYILQRVMRSANVIAHHNHQRHQHAELRDPLMYRPLIEFMLAVPWPDKIEPHGDRLLQRRALAGILSAETLRRDDKGGSDQAACDGLASSKKWFDALTARPRIVERGYARLDAWRDAVRRARVGRTSGLKYFQASATLEIWLQQLETRPFSQEKPVAPSPLGVL